MRPITTRVRRDDWIERLDALTRERLVTPFAWGPHDCCSWAADVTLAITGEDPLAAYRGRYASEEEALTLMAGQTLPEFVAGLLAAFGAPSCPPRFAQRGDWVLCSVGNDLMCGVVAGHTILAPGMERLQALPLRRAVAAWAI